MKKVFLFFLLQIFFVTALDAKEVVLTATLKYENKSGQEVKNAYHRITIPAETFYQKVTDIKLEGVPKYKIKMHRNNIDRYIKLYFNIPAYSEVIKTVSFTININKQKLDLNDSWVIPNKESLLVYTQPSKRIESGAKQIKAISYLIDKNSKSIVEKVKLAYEFTARYIKFSDMDKKTSALAAIKTGRGDCTEYAYVFVSLLRALDIPARKTTYFSFKEDKTFLQPNHNAVDVFTNKYGWVPVYPNLSHGKYENSFQFGNISDDLVLYKQGNSWTHYHNIAAQEGVDESKIHSQINWKIVTLKP